jgi:DNA processing protein
VPLRPDSIELGWWLALHRAPQSGARTRVELLEHFGSIDAVFAATGAELERALPERPEAVSAILAGADAAALDTLRAWLAQDVSHHFLVWNDPDYPPLLREIADPPIALHVIGTRASLARPQLGVVGSRNPTPAGAENARAFARALSQAGLVITSGMALGIDGAAHRGALDAGGQTIAVCGTGLDRVYPARHRELAHAIADNGALVSEYPLGTPPLPGNFPVRNRLISGLSLGVLVVEAALDSGSLISARLATEQGREVFAIPGSIHSPLARGCHTLIRQGAKLVESANDVIEELGALAEFARASAPPTVNAPANLPRPAAHLLDALGYDPVTLDALVERSGLTADAVSSMLVTLELEGLVATMPGGRYQRMP